MATKVEMATKALFVRLEAKPGKEADVERFIKDGLQIVQEEPATTSWFGIRLGPSTFGIFDTFPDESGRQAHLSGRVAAALKAKASELLLSRRRSNRSMFSRPSCPPDAAGGTRPSNLRLDAGTQPVQRVPHQPLGRGLGR